MDDAWFGRKEVFNREIIREDGTHDWEITERPIVFGKPHSRTKKQSWQQYVEDRRLEITCGEAPYLVSRYDPATGTEIPLFIENEAGVKIYRRIGMLDRKLQVITQFETTPSKWMNRAHTALKSIYGFEWQGDSLLLAREAILISVIEYFKAAFPDEPGNLVNNQTFSKWVNNCACFISWNIWQMDGLGFILPNSGKGIKVAQKSETDNSAQLDLFSAPTREKVEKEIEDARSRAPKILSQLRSLNLNTDTGIPAIVSDWNHSKDESRHVFFYSLINK